MSQNWAHIIGGVFGGLLLSFLLYMFGDYSGRDGTRIEAVMNGVGIYKPDKDGRPQFQWRTCK